MKNIRIFSFITCLIMASCFLILFVPGISNAEDTKEKQYVECVNKCADKGNVCINMTADTRRCNAIVQECIDACKKEVEASPSSK
jgi:hypothetical protein